MAFMAAIAPFLSIASGVMGAIGAIQQGNAAAASAKSQQNAMEYNAAIERQRAQSALEMANSQEEQNRVQSRKAIGSQRASLVENGIGLDSGTGNDLVKESSLNAELDALNIRYGGQMQARGYSQQAALDDVSAKSAGNRASEARTAGYFGAASSLLTGAGGYAEASARNDARKSQTKTSSLSYYGG